MTARRQRNDPGDRGSVLILALVFTLIGALMVLPLLSYSMSVMRANAVLSDKTQRVEAVKGGLRASLADPLDLYKTCATDEALGVVSINGMTVHNECRILDAAQALAETEIRYGIATTQVDQGAPTFFSGSRYESSDPTSATGWLADTTLDSVTGKVMLPNLPAYGTSPRSVLGSQMPVEYILGQDDVAQAQRKCTVYFPGKYNDPLTIDGPTFFVNGIYYFTQTVRILGGADVVVGDGTVEGCTTSHEAVFYADPAPSGSHNVNGLGATWVLGGAGRVVFDNTVARDGSANIKPIQFTFNQRYVEPDDTATLPSADVSILTVNGDPLRTPDIPGEGHYLEVYDPVDPSRPILHVPEQFVGAVPDDVSTPDVNESNTVRDTGTTAISNGYVPSVYTPQPRVPSAPTGVTVQARQGHLIVAWGAPADDGNSPIVQYVARAWVGNGTTEVQSCTTNGALTCVIAGLDTSLDHTVTVEAVNYWMTQQSPSPTANRWSTNAKWRPGGTAPVLAAPAIPAKPSVTMYRADPITDARTAGIAHVTMPVPETGSTPVVGYDIEIRQTHTGDGTALPSPQWASCNGADTAPDIDATVTVLEVPRLYCDFTGIDPTGQYEFRVVARATDALSTPSATPHTTFTRTAAATIVAGAPNHAALDTTDPSSPYFGKLSPYVSSTWSAHADHTPGPAALPTAALPTPIIAFNLTNSNATATATINIASYIAVPQGRFSLDNPNGWDVHIGGGILAASITANDSRSTCPPDSTTCVPGTPEIVPVGFRPVDVQRKFQISSWVDEGSERSVAVVQVNQNGAYAVNSWEVQ